MISLPNFKLYYKATVNQENLVVVQNRAIDQWNRIETPDINPNIYGQLIYDKGTMDTQWEMTASSTTGVGKTGQLHVRE